MTETERQFDLALAECEAENRLLRARNERLENRQWVELTEGEVDEILDAVIGFNSCFGPETEFARAIEVKLKEKNT